MSMTDAAAQALKALGKPATVREIYAEIQKKKLFTFGAKDPVSVLGGAMRRRTAGSLTLKGEPMFKVVGKATYVLL